MIMVTHNDPPVYTGSSKKMIENKHETIYELYKKLENTKTPETKRQLMEQIDKGLDEILTLQGK